MPTTNKSVSEIDAEIHRCTLEEIELGDRELEKSYRNGFDRDGCANKVRPKPKFKIGQVLCWGTRPNLNYERVRKIYWNRGDDSYHLDVDSLHHYTGWLYDFDGITDYRERQEYCVTECELRPLTEKEKGF